MKFNFILFLLVIVSLLLNGQPLQKKQHYLLEDNVKISQNENQITKSRTLGGGDIIFMETFDSTLWHTANNDGIAVPANMPNGWTAFDATGNNFFWRWSTTGPRGAYTSTPWNEPNNAQKVKSTSDNALGGERGFMVLESDFFNTNSEGQESDILIVMDSYIQSRAIEATEHPAVQIYFEQWHRFCCTSYGANVGPKLFVSNDGTNWTRFDVHDAGINQTPVKNPSVVELSLTAVAANQSTVYIRFHHIGQDAYHWSIDDITLFEPPAYDTRLVNYWADYGEGKFAYYTNINIAKLFSAIPYYSAYHSFQNLVSSRGLAQNYGTNNCTNLTLTTTLYQGENEIYSKTSSPISTHLSGNVDSIETMHNFQLPVNESNIGEWHVSGMLEMVETDEFPENNNSSYNFNITRNLFGYANPEHVNTERSSPYNYVGSSDGDGVGVVFMLNQSSPFPYTLEGINIYIPGDGYNWQLWENGNFAFLSAEVYEGTLVGQEYQFDMSVPMIMSEASPIDSLMSDTWVYLPFVKDGASENISPTNDGQQYLVLIRFVTNNSRFYIGSDKITQPSFYSNWLIQGNEPGWVSATTSISIQLVLNKFNESNTNTAQFMVSNTSTSGTNVAEGAIITIYSQNNVFEPIETNYVVGSTGIVNIPNLRSGSYSYSVKYLGETKKGSVTVYGTDVIVPISFDITGIDNQNHVSTLKIYPNPVTNFLTIESNSNTSKIVITNILGQIIETFDNPRCVEELSVRNYSMGIYLVTSIDKNGNKITNKLIKQ